MNTTTNNTTNDNTKEVNNYFNARFKGIIILEHKLMYRV